MNQRIASQVELLHAYHLDLWSEMEAQLRVIRGAQDQIATLRAARITTDESEELRRAAQLLARHVQTLRGRIRALSETTTELASAVDELLKLLSDDDASRT